MPVTLLYASILGLLFLLLSINVARLRGKHKVPFGTEGSIELARAARTQANFVECVPLLLLLMALLESLQSSRYLLHAIGILAVVARLLHAWGLSRNEALSAPRGIGAGLTFLLILVCCLWGLWRSIFALSLLH